MHKQIEQARVRAIMIIIIIIIIIITLHSMSFSSLSLFISVASCLNKSVTDKQPSSSKIRHVRQDSFCEQMLQG